MRVGHWVNTDFTSMTGDRLMIKGMLATVVLILGAAVTLAPVASAQEDYIDPTGPYDATDYFVTPFDPQAFDAKSEKGLILSPYGTQGLQCRGFHGRIWDCTQTLDDGSVNRLIRLSPDAYPSRTMREVWVYDPLNTGSAG
ncbi:hypothetical protein [Rhodococcus gordoniae]